MSFGRWWQKANAYAAAWSKIFAGEIPSKYNVALGLGVAEHETWCGDAWKGEHNWGAVQLRGLNAVERGILSQAGLTASSANLPQAKALLGANSAVGGALHIDTSPVAGPYFVWFCAFPDDETGAEKFVQVLAKNRPSCCDVLESNTPSALGLASAMYKSHYYEGFHDPHKPGGDDANILDYTNAISALTNEAYEALADWEPGKNFPAYVPTDPSTFDLETITGVQQAWNFLALPGNTIPVSGLMDAATKNALMSFQRTHLGPFMHPLSVDGNPGPDTVYALQAALGTA